MLDEIPLEVLRHISQFLRPRSLKALRLVNTSLSIKLIGDLFKTIDISCLHQERLSAICNHPDIAPAVEQLRYHEIDFQMISNEEDLNRAVGWISDVIIQYGDSLRRVPSCEKLVTRWPQDRHDLYAFLCKDWEMPNAEHQSSDMEISEPGSSSSCASHHVSLEHDSHHLVGLPPRYTEAKKWIFMAILNEYAETAEKFNLECLSTTFCENLPMLTRLKGITCIDAREDGICKSSSFLPLHLKRFQDLFPLSEGVFHNVLSPYTTSWPGRGFLAFWRALSELGDRCSHIEHLGIGRDNLFIGRGIAFGGINEVGPKSASGFCNLTSLKICFEISEIDPTLQNESQDLEFALSSTFVEALECAQKLTHLEISVTSPSDSDLPLNAILPMGTQLCELRALTLVDIHFKTTEFCQWLFLQPKLRHIVLRRPWLHGHWKDLARRLSQRIDFVLDSIELVSPWDNDLICGEEIPLSERMVPSRVSNEALLDYINNGGENPFANRKWKGFDSVSHPSGSEVIDDHMSDYSDMSEWVETNNPDASEDPDGPEFYSDYDFDGESDSGFETDTT